jgi:hypothetical protein
MALSPPCEYHRTCFPADLWKCAENKKMTGDTIEKQYRNAPTSASGETN